MIQKIRKAIQRFLRRAGRDSVSGIKSFIYGPSTSNQRIEAWWSFFKKSRSSWWINFFKDLIEQGIYDPSIPEHKKCMQFCFMEIIQKELDNTKFMWNSHHIRHVQNSECPNGKPDFLYFCSDLDFKFEINQNDILVSNEFVVDRQQIIEENLLYQQCQNVFNNEGFVYPTTAHEAAQLFLDNMIRFL